MCPGNGEGATGSGRLGILMAKPLNPAVTAYNVRRCHVCRGRNAMFGFGTPPDAILWACPQHRAEVDAIWTTSRIRPRQEPVTQPTAPPVVKPKARAAKRPTTEQESML